VIGGLPFWSARRDERPDLDRQVVLLRELGVDVLVVDPDVRPLELLPARAWRMIGRAMLIGIEKPMPFESLAIAVLMPTTAPVASRSGPPLLPGLIAASVWMRFRRLGRRRDLAALGRDDAARHGVRERPERAADRDDELADLRGASESPRRAAGRSVASTLTIARSVQRVDAVDRARVLRAVLELDGELVAAGDDVAVREDPAARVEDDAGADPLLVQVVALGIDALVNDPDDRRPAFAATSMIADDSSIVTGCLTEVCSRSSGAVERAVEGAGRGEAANVPPEARTAEQRGGDDRPAPVPDRPPAAAVRWRRGDGCTGAGRRSPASNQCSGVAGCSAGRPARRGPLVARLGRREKNELSIGLGVVVLGTVRRRS
jgi:hypothetical protein